METTKNKKFDAVQMMRDIRDKINQEISSMSFEEQQKYLKEKALKREFSKQK